jgi:4'-phosphopantetheinyl transferase EntD
VDSLLEGLLPEDVRAIAAPIHDCVSALRPEERRFVERAVPTRQREFATGRELARGLLTELGHADFTLLREEDRIPRWPDGVVGSITHAADLCAVAVARGRDYHGVGIDLEPDEAVDKDIERVVCRDAEHDWVAAAGEDERGVRCRIVFSVKEAVYKAFYPKTRQFWSFQDVTVAIDLDDGCYRARLPGGAGVDEVTGRVRRDGGWIVSTLAVSRGAMGLQD